uniref:Ig-like domain-containing protein n=1 Tax=Poecilia latipinna TaxID=48699 RepID=A0A3B3VST2_9TELE
KLPYLTLLLNYISDQTLHHFSGEIPKPNITLQPAGLVSWGQSVSIRCDVMDGLSGSFIFTNAPSSVIQTINSNSNSATFHIAQVRLGNEGLYQCRDYTSVSFNGEFLIKTSTPASVTLSN